MLMELQNWVLYYSLIGRHLTELMPIIYTPTEVRCLQRVRACAYWC
jgi:malate dehydrogenase (oxaloacetate-decarboxylating)